MTQAIPKGYTSLTPSFTFKDSQKAIDFYKKAFDAKAVDVFPNVNGKGVMHAVLQIGDAMFMMGDEMPGGSCKSAETVGTSPISLFLYVGDADAAFKKAVEAGAKSIMPVADMFWGDRCGTVEDPFGYQWMIGTHTKDMTKEEIRKGAEEFFAKMGK